MESVTATYRGLDHDDPRVEVGLLATASSSKHRLGKLEPTDARDQCQALNQDHLATLGHLPSVCPCRAP